MRNGDRTSLQKVETASSSRDTDRSAPSSATEEVMDESAILFDERLDHIKPLTHKLFYACRPAIKKGAKILLEHAKADIRIAESQEADFTEQVLSCLGEVVSLQGLCDKVQSQANVEDTMLYWRCEHLKQDLQAVESWLRSISADTVESSENLQSKKRDAKAILNQYRNDPKDHINTD